MLVIGTWLVIAVALVAFAPGEAHDIGVFIGGVAFGLGVWLWDDPPEYIERWRRGAEGEKQTAKALKRLAPDWAVAHDIARERGQ